jgi:hypothetical protein
MLKKLAVCAKSLGSSHMNLFCNDRRVILGQTFNNRWLATIKSRSAPSRTRNISAKVRVGVGSSCARVAVNLRMALQGLVRAIVEEAERNPELAHGPVLPFHSVAPGSR